jgi:hypothetical protein
MKRVAGALAFLCFLYDAVLPAWNRPSSDFPNYYTAAVLVRTGQPLHLFYDWSWFQRRMHFAGIERQLGGYMPQTPLTMLPFVPLAALSPLAARRVWLVLNLFFLAATLWLLSRITRLDFVALGLLAFLGYPALRGNIILGQYYLFLLMLLTAAVWLLLRHRDWASGALAALAFVLKLYGAPLLLLFAVLRRGRAALSFLFVSLMLTCLAVVLFGWHDLAYFATGILPRALAGESLNPFHPSNGTGITMLRRLFVAEAELNPHPVFNNPTLFSFLKAFFVTLIVGLLVAGAFRRTCNLKTTLAWWLVGTLLISPNTASYTFVLLLLPVALVLNEWLTAGRFLQSGMLVLAYVLLCLPLWPVWAWIFPRFWLLLILFAAIGFVAIDRRQLSVAAIVALAAACLALRSTPAQAAHRAVVEAGAVYSSSPVCSNAGLVYESIGRDRYVIRRGNETFAVHGDAFHPSTPASGDPIYFEAVRDRESRIMRIDTRTHVLETVPVGIRDPSEPAVSHDGKTLAFHAGGKLYIFDGANSREIGETGPAGDSSFSPAFSSDNTRLLFAGRQRIGSVEISSGSIEWLSPTTDTARPQMSADGRRLLFAQRQGSTWQIHIRDLATGAERQITHGACNNDSPTWDEKSGDIVYASDCGRGAGLPGLFRMHAPE